MGAANLQDSAQCTACECNEFKAFYEFKAWVVLWLTGRAWISRSLIGDRHGLRGAKGGDASVSTCMQAMIKEALM